MTGFPTCALPFSSFFFFNDTATTEIYTLSLHDALPICRSGLMIQEYTPHRGSGDKTARLNSVADIVRSGLVWVPQTRWAEEVVEEVAGFPFMSNDDLVDTTIMALMRFRQGGFISLPTDEAESEPLYRHRGGFY